MTSTTYSSMWRAKAAANAINRRNTEARGKGSMKLGRVSQETRKSEPQVESNMTVVVIQKDQYIEPLAWVNRARAKSDVRRGLNYLIVEKERILATDGHRAHIWHGTHPGLKPGYYTVVKGTKTRLDLDRVDKPDFTFPDIDNVIPKKAAKPLKLDTHREQAFFQTMTSQNKDSKLEETMLVNFDYFTDTWCIGNTMQNAWELSNSHTQGPLRFDRDNLTAIIMPMRGDRIE